MAALLNILISQNYARLRLRRTAFTIGIVLALTGESTAAVLTAPVSASPGEVTFDPSFLVGGGHIDLSRFSHVDAVLPGRYKVDISVQQGWRGSQYVTFRALPGQPSAVPCFDKALLTQLGVDWTKLSQAKGIDGSLINPVAKLGNGMVCGDLGTLIPRASDSYDSSSLALAVSIPQLYLKNHVSGWVDSSQWNYGVNAATLAYNISSYSSHADKREQTDVFASINAGINLGGWRLRHTGALQYIQGMGARYQATSSYIQHDLTSARAQLTFGDSYTEGNMFDSMAFRGARFASDNEMLPDSQRGFAPIIRGSANSTAKVTISQHGVQIYQTVVPAGPFKIDDLYPNGYAGDLQVSIAEADGSQRTFTVPYASTPQSLRPGIANYSFAVGEVSQNGLRHKPYLMQATWQRGINNFLTGYTGMTLASGYGAGLIGAALNTRLGGISIDLSGSRSHIPGQSTSQGGSLRLGYSKMLNSLGTQVSLATYRFSSSGYLGFSDAMNAISLAERGGGTLPRRRGQFSIDVSQSLGSFGGSLYVNGTAIQYWHGEGNNVTFSAGYSNRFRSISYGMSVQRTRDLSSNSTWNEGLSYSSGDFQLRRVDTQLMFTVSVPLGSGSHSAYLNSSVQLNDNGEHTEMASLTGSLGSKEQFSYGVSASQQTGEQGGDYDFNGQYRGSRGIVGASYGNDSGSSQVGLSASGGVVLHAGGVTFAQQLTDNIAIVNVPGAAGAEVVGSSNNIRVDSHGYAIVPYLEPYHIDSVSIDPKGLPLNIELKDTTANIAPRSGAVVRLNYRTVTGYAAMIDGTFAGKPLPFGADVLNVHGNSVGSVGQAGRMVVYGITAHGQLMVSWGERANERCVFAYTLPADKKRRQTSLVHISAQCVDAVGQAGSSSHITKLNYGRL